MRKPSTLTAALLKKSEPSPSTVPRRSPPTTAPGRLPMPPMMIMMNALTTGSAPMAGLTAKSGASKPPADPASAQPIAKAPMETTSIFTPCSAAPSGSWATARMAPHRREHHHEPLDRDDEPAQADNAGEGRRHRLVQHAEGELRPGLEHPQEAQGDDERVERLPPQVPEDQPLGHEPHESHHDDGQEQRQEVGQPGHREAQVGDVAPEHVEIAVGKVDDLEDRKDQGEAQRHQHVDERQREAVQQPLGQELDRRTYFFITFNAAGRTCSMSTLFPLRISLITIGYRNWRSIPYVSLAPMASRPHTVSYGREVSAASTLSVSTEPASCIDLVMTS